MAYPVSQIIYRAYRLAGILTQAGRWYSSSQADDGVQVLNSLLSEWQTERLMVWTKARLTFELKANQQVYTIGTDTDNSQPDFFAPRPVTIENAGFIFTNVSPTIEQPMVCFTSQQWAALYPKQLTSTLPTSLWYEKTVPNGTIWVFPIPTTAWGPDSIALYLWQNLQEVSSADDIIQLAPGYQAAIEYNLALRLAMQFPTRAKPAPNLAALAIGIKRKLFAVNTETLLMQVEQGNGAQRSTMWSIWSNSYLPGRP